MAKPRLYNHTRFDGGMTHNNRDTSDLTKSSFIAHLDIYRENHRAYVMPGFVSDNAYDGSATGLKTYDIRNFEQNFNVLYGLGTLADGTGSKLFQRNMGDTEWIIPTDAAYQGEGSKNLPAQPFFTNLSNSGDFYYPELDTTHIDIAISGFSANASAGGYETAWFNSWLTDSNFFTGHFYNVKAFNGVMYLNRGNFSGVSSITTSTVSTAKTTAIFPKALTSGDYTLGVFGTQSGPRESRLLIWDATSLLADQNVKLGNEEVKAAGYPNNVFCSIAAATSNNDLESNGQAFMSVRAIQGESAQLLYRLYAPTETNLSIHDINAYYLNSMLWYGRIPTNTDGDEFNEGVWALGSGSAASQFGTSMLLDTTSLGLVERVKSFGFGMYFAHNSDGSVSRLDDYQTGTYDVPGYIETLFYGADTPLLKQLEGISVVTENLPVGGTVEVQYRTDENVAFTSMGTSDTDDKQVHNFTKVAGVPIGKFREIQFKIILTGKIALKSYLVSTTENDDLSFSV